MDRLEHDLRAGVEALGRERLAEARRRASWQAAVDERLRSLEAGQGDLRLRQTALIGIVAASSFGQVALEVALRLTGH